MGLKLWWFDNTIREFGAYTCIGACTTELRLLNFIRRFCATWSGNFVTFWPWQCVIYCASHAWPTYQFWLSYDYRVLSYELLNLITFLLSCTVTAYMRSITWPVHGGGGRRKTRDLTSRDWFHCASRSSIQVNICCREYYMGCASVVCV